MDMDAFMQGVEPLEQSLDELENDWVLDREIIWVVGATADYAVPVEYGTDPHTIRADDAEALHFKIDGEEIFIKEVDHPGTQAQPYMRPGTDVVRARLGKIVDEAESYPEYMEKVARAIERQASQFAPVDDGNLKGSIGARQVE